jgi:hypothetical protein
MGEFNSKFQNGIHWRAFMITGPIKQVINYRLFPQISVPYIGEYKDVSQI